MAYVTSLKVAPQTGGDGLLYATWSFDETKKKLLDHYKVVWTYATGDGVWFTGSTEEISKRVSTYSPPSNATKARVQVRPVSITYKVNDEDRHYYVGVTKSYIYVIPSEEPDLDTPSAPTVEISNTYELTASVTVGSDTKATQVKFVVYKGYKIFKRVRSPITKGDASISVEVESGYEYRVKCRLLNLPNSNDADPDDDVASPQHSKYSDYSAFVGTVPAAVKIVSCKADSETSVRIEWEKDTTATSHTVEYTLDKRYFGRTTSEVSSTTSESAIVAYVTGLETGNKYYFRIKASNDQGDTPWSSVVSAIIGTTPDAPTTWSSTTTAYVGETVKLYWVHNSEDGSEQTGARIAYKTKIDEDYKLLASFSDDTSEYTLSTSGNASLIKAGTNFWWKVRTKGITDEYSEFSTTRKISFYEPPTVSIENGSSSTVDGFPIAVNISAGPSSQTAIRYYVTIKALTTYEGQDDYGSATQIYAGEEIYSKYIDKKTNSLSFSIGPSDVSLESGERYQMDVTVAMNSGLTATDSWTFTADWTDDELEPDAQLSYSKSKYIMNITPYCEDSSGKLVDDVRLYVYRREFDGSYTTVKSNVKNTGTMTVTDPHPALDYARYRIAALNTNTGHISYVDLPGYPIQEHSIIIQWDEEWTEFDYTEEAAAVEPPWTGSLVKLPWNVDISENHDSDVELVEYIGRKHPVGYYGTQTGESAQWSTDIDKTDKDTIYALRRLAVYMGRVYVREPSGTGYWAQISVSMNTNHSDLTIPVTLSITRVEGGR